MSDDSGDSDDLFHQFEFGEPHLQSQAPNPKEEETISQKPAPFSLVYCETSKDLDRARMIKEVGNSLFKKALYPQAIESYEEALAVCPEEEKALKAQCHSNIAICHGKLGSQEQLIDECGIALSLAPRFAKPLANKAMALYKLGYFEESLEDWVLLKQIDEDLVDYSIFEEVSMKVARMKEKEKEKALDDLKGISNMVLGKLGFSLENFKREAGSKPGNYTFSFENKNKP